MNVTVNGDEARGEVVVDDGRFVVAMRLVHARNWRGGRALLHATAATKHDATEVVRREDLMPLAETALAVVFRDHGHALAVDTSHGYSGGDIALPPATANNPITFNVPVRPANGLEQLTASIVEVTPS